MANRREFMRTLSGVAALSITTDVSHLGRMRFLRMATAMPDASPHDRLQPDWYRRKVIQVQQQMKERKLNALLLLDATNIIYTVGYFHLSTERPLATLIPQSGDPVMFVPGLETDQVKTWWVKDYESYFDFPGPVNRVRWIFERVAKRGFDRARIGVEEPRPSRLLVETLRLVKDEDEIRIMRRAMSYADFKVQAGREFVQHNGSVSEDEILKVTADAVADRMSKELNDVVGVGIDPPFGGLVPFGKRSAFPHAVPSKDRLKTGDALILSFGAQVGGYNVECERSFCVGKPNDYAKRLFDAMLAAHDVGVENLKEGAVAEEVDQKSLDQIRKAGFETFLRHRTGHGIGLEGHESPWIAEGDKTVLQQGMTFSCEPGVYDPDWGGFRHSDTVVVRKDKGEVLNSYPTRLEDMVIEI
jgi:Xaa-Pro dipeptidase